MTFEPELGQMAFSNSRWGDIETPEYMSASVENLGEELKVLGLAKENPCYNTGASFENDVFALRAYCWCDGNNEGHGECCPPNFEYKVWPEFAMFWYKHSRRGDSVTDIPQPKDWYAAMVACEESIIKEQGNGKT